jgi:hypothetical protein
MIDVNQVVGKTASGSKIGQGNVTSNKTSVTITGATDTTAEMVATLKHVLTALKHDNADNSTHHFLQMIYRDPVTKLVSTTVTCEQLKGKESRAQPRKKLRTAEAITAEQWCT